MIWSEERGGERVGMVERQSQREKFILTTLAMADEIYLAVQVLGGDVSPAADGGDGKGQRVRERRETGKIRKGEGGGNAAQGSFNGEQFRRR